MARFSDSYKKCEGRESEVSGEREIEMHLSKSVRMSISRTWFAILLAIGMVAPMLGFASETGTGGKPDLEYETLEGKKTLSAVNNRGRIYSEIRIEEGTSQLSSGKKTFTVDGEEVELGLFEGVRVKRLIFPSSVRYIDSSSLKGIDGLEEIVFEGDIPDFKEAHSFFKWGEDDWRDNLKKIVLKGGAQGLGKIDFISYVKCIELAETVREKDLYGWARDMPKCASLERLVVPYRLAARPLIPWGKIVRAAPLLSETAVVSEPNADRASVLLGAGDEDKADIPEGVTYVRIDAIEHLPSVILPFTFRGFIGGDADPEKLYYLRKDSVNSVPDVISPQGRSRVRFSSRLPRAILGVSSAYPRLLVCVDNGKARPVYYGTLGDGDENGESVPHISRTSLGLDMGATYTLTFALPTGTGKDGKTQILPVVLDNGALNVQPITFDVPEGEMNWIWGLAVISLIGCCGLPVLMWFCSARLGPLWVGRVLAPRYFAAPWWSHALWCASVVIFALGVTGVLGELMDLYVWYPVLRYVNMSMLSSLVISVTSTGLQMILGLLQGFTVNLFLVTADLERMLAPVVDMLSRISWMSWLSTMVLALTRLFGEILRLYGTFIWSCIGLGCLSWSLPGLTAQRTWKPLRIFLACSVGLGLALPLTLFVASWVSTEMTLQVGRAFDDAMGYFAIFVEQMSWKSFTSVAALQTQLGLLSDGIASLMSSAVNYLAVKAFDCFVIPLALLWCGLKILKSFGYKRETDLRGILNRRVLLRDADRMPAALAHAEAHPEIRTLEGPRRHHAKAIPVGQRVRRQRDERKAPSLQEGLVDKGETK